MRTTLRSPGTRSNQLSSKNQPNGGSELVQTLVGWNSHGSLLGVLDGDWQTAVIARWHELPAERHGPMETSLCLLGVTGREHHPLEVS